LAGEPLAIAGRWRVQFERDPHPSVGVFEADPYAPGEVRGTFLTVTGDYRYLAGTARGDELALSCFDGAHAFLFRARRGPDGGLSGDFWSGAKWHEKWTAVRDADAALPDAFGLVNVQRGVALGELVYPGVDGERRALKSDFGRATIVQLFGTWCPNCGDAGLFLRELEREYGARGLAIVGLAFEHGGDLAAQRARVAAYAERRGGTWPIFLAGPSDKAAAGKVFPVLDKVLAYPTTLFVDADGVVRAVHTGFAGPATGAAHTELAAAFRARIERLLAE
jgi:thiol-disulfide isomerase/thioredoxin